MGIIISLTLIAFGAILTWAVNTDGGSVDPQVVGVILMVVGFVVFAHHNSVCGEVLGHKAGRERFEGRRCRGLEHPGAREQRHAIGELCRARRRRPVDLASSVSCGIAGGAVVPAPASGLRARCLHLSTIAASAEGVGLAPTTG